MDAETTTTTSVAGPYGYTLHVDMHLQDMQVWNFYICDSAPECGAYVEGLNSCRNYCSGTGAQEASDHM